MKKIFVAFLLLVMAAPAFAGLPYPSPKYVAATTFAAGEDINLLVKGRQTGTVYAAKYITLACTQDVYVAFNVGSEDTEFYSATVTDAMDGDSADHQVTSTVFIKANTKTPFSGNFRTITSITAAVPGTLEVWAEYGQ